MSRFSRHWKKSTLLVLAAAAASVGLLVLGSQSLFGSTSSNSSSPWRLIPKAPIEVDAGLTSVWTGEEMLVSGVRAAPDGTLARAVDVAATYDPAADTWRRIAAPPATESYCRRSAVWTGREMLVWGCGLTAFSPRTGAWRRLPPAPSGAAGLVVWTGRELIGWGGGCCGDAEPDGAAYDPATERWRRLAASPLAASQSPVGTWTGRELVILVSGIDPDGEPISGAARAAAYSPKTDTWRLIPPPPALRATAVWDGHEILLVGGTNEHGVSTKVGYAYDPVANRWRSLPAMPSGRAQAGAVWTGTQLLFFGGERTANALLSYDPKRNRWSSLPSAPLRRRTGPAAVWTGRELMVWGGAIGTPAGTSIAPEHPADGAAFDATSKSCCRGAQ
jgi:N-acetylneuraminic acid mutarotase